jgi:hypothetical protein
MQYETIDDVRISIEDRLDPAKEKRLTLDISKIKKPAPEAPTLDVELKEAAYEDNNIDDLYTHMHAIFVTFLADLEVTNPGPTLSYLSSKKREVYEEVVYKHLSKKNSASGDAFPSDNSVKKIKLLLDKYEDNLQQSVLDRCNVAQLYKIAFDPSSDVQIALKKSLVSLGWIVEKFVFNPLDKKLYKKKGASVVECGPTEIIGVLQEYNRLIAQVTEKPSVGKRCYTIWQKGKLTFKIRDNDSTSGAVCDSSPPKEKILDIISTHMKKEIGHLNTKGYTKLWLCTILEIVSRSSKEFQMAARLAARA